MIRAIPVILLATLTAWAFPLTIGAATPDAHVVVVTIDGLPAYLLNDPKASLPTLRKLAAGGVAAEGMRPVNPSVTWPNHTSLVTGVRPDRHGCLFNGVLVRAEPNRPVKVEGERDQADLVAVPTLWDTAKAAGLRTAAINWPCTRGSKALDDNFPDVPGTIDHATPRLRDELLATGVLPEATHAAFSKQSMAARDEVWAQAACRVIRERKPHLLLLHLLVTDGIHHQYGAQSHAGYAAVALADAQLREVLRALEDAGIRERTTVFVVSDHGFATAEKLLLPNVLFRKAGLMRNAAIGVTLRAKAQAISEGGTAMVYLTDPETAAEDRKAALEALRGQEGIAEVIEPDQYAKHGLPDPKKNPQMADFILVAKPGYAFFNTATGEDYVVPTTMGKTSVGFHGYPATDPKMQATFVAAGRGVRRGAKVGAVENIDVAPTAARLLGLEMKGVDGKVLAEVLEEETKR